MRVCIFASSSSGNCMLLSQGKTNILIDAGITMRRIVKSLAQAGLSMEDIGGVLITHEHSDHISGLKMLLKHYPIEIYAPRTVAACVVDALPEAEGRVHVIPVGERFEIGELSVLAFHTSHDTDESVGYRFDAEGSFAVATDTGCVTDEIKNAITGAETVLLESNYDEQLLINGPYPPMLKRRILSNRGHLANNDCAEFARFLVENGTSRVILGHLSRTNNTPELALAASAKMLEGIEALLLCAPETGFMDIELGEHGNAEC